MQKKKIKIIVELTKKRPVGKIVYKDKKDKKNIQLPTHIPGKYSLNIDMAGDGYVLIEENKIVKVLDASEKELPLFEKKKKTTSTNHPSPVSEKKYDLPDDTNKIIQDKKILPDNYNLWVNKVTLKDDHHYRYLLQDKRGNILNHRGSNFKKQSKLINEIQARQKLLLTGNEIPIKLHVDQRMAIGLGGASVYETSMTLHHIYGIPYIPGSAVKGVTRSWCIQENHNNSKKSALTDSDFCAVFGNEEQKDKKGKRGQIIFFDAFPTEPPNVKIDIMNPHYGEYYSSEGKTPPADYLSPNPIYFLTVEKTPFQFYLACMPLHDEKSTDGSKILSKAREWLVAALTKHGIGAKTSVGYGFFKNTK